MKTRCRTAVIARLVFLPLSVLLFGGCGPHEEAVRVDLTEREDTTSEFGDRVIVTYAYLPQYAHEESYRRHHGLVVYLRKVTGLNMKQVFPSSFDEHMKMVGRREIDISYSNPFIYAKMAHQYRIWAFARVVEPSGGKDFRGQIIVRSDNQEITAIKDCIGKRWMAVDANSAAAYLYPLALFHDHGIAKEAFTEIMFAPGPGGQQEKVVLAVWARKCDFGSIREGTLDIALKAHAINPDNLRVLAETPWYPGWVYAARDGLDINVVRRIADALIALNENTPEHGAILHAARVSDIVAAQDSEFDCVRQLALDLNLDFGLSALGLTLRQHAVLDAAAAELTRMATSPVVVKAVTASNARHASLTQLEIDALDREWRDNRDQPICALIRDCIENPCGLFLREEQNRHAEFAEIFAMDNRGLIACASDVTTDYWQGDEEKWQNVFGQDAVWWSKPVYDESSRAMVVQVSVPVRDVGALCASVHLKTLLEP